MNPLRAGSWKASFNALDNASDLNARVCVIGSGPGGGIVAGELARKGHDVLVLEAGPVDTALKDDGIASVHSQGRSRLEFSRAFQYGGSSNLWAGKVLPLEPIDFEERHWMDEAGWPLSTDDIQSYFDKVYDLMGLNLPEWEVPSSLSNLEMALQTGDLDLKPYVESRKRFRVADYLDECLRTNRGRLRIVTEAPVSQLVTAPDGRVHAARVVQPDGQHHDVTADLFVLANGGLEVPRLLLTSHHHHAAGLGNGHDLVGRYLGTHPKGDIAVLRLAYWVSTRNPLFAAVKKDNHIFRVGLGFSREAQRKHQLLNHYVELWPYLANQSARLFENAKDSIESMKDIMERNAFIRRTMLGAGLFGFRAVGKIGQLQLMAKSFVIRIQMDQYPDPDNRVTLSSERDHLGRPKIDIHWQFTQRDQRALLDYMSRLDEALRTHQVGSIDMKSLDQFNPEDLYVLYAHLIGTSRMGHTPKTGVVDRNNRVFESRNLYISGPSVFPTYGYANPFLTIAALAFRLSDHLDRELS